MDLFLQNLLTVLKFILAALSVAVLVRCLRSMLSERYESETWAYMRVGQDAIPVRHWENIIGRSHSADIRVSAPDIGRVHAVLVRGDSGQWRIFNVFSRGGVWVNGIKVGAKGRAVLSGDVINLAGSCLRFIDITTERRLDLESGRVSAGSTVSPAVTLVELTLFQLLLLLEYAISAKSEYLLSIVLAFASVVLLEWFCYNAMRLMERTGFETETLAFYLTTLGLAVAASSTPEDMYKQLLLILASVLLFLLCGLWLRRLGPTAALRIPVAIIALALMAVNVVTSDVSFGARNWLQIGGYSFQPSELVKFAYIYAGASTLDRLYRGRNLFGFIGFSAACVVALALIGDFGSALIFFVCFLVMSFMRTGSVATVFLAVSGAGLAGFLAVTVKPYIAQRFDAWGHVWEDVYDKGYQQTRAMSAAAAGGLFGKGAGQGWLSDIFAANTDMVFAMVCEELGLIIGVCAVLCVLVLAFFAVRSAGHGRSAYYSIAACAAMSMLLVQMALNVFGSLDILPFTGVTFPFVSKGGTSLLSCWMLMAFIKSSDTRRGASFAVRPIKKLKTRTDDEDTEELYDEDDLGEEDYLEYDGDWYEEEDGTDSDGDYTQEDEE